MLAVSRTVPIVITYGNYDPIARGYVTSLAHPGGNITGVSFAKSKRPRSRSICLRTAFLAGGSASCLTPIRRTSSARPSALRERCEVASRSYESTLATTWTKRFRPRYQWRGDGSRLSSPQFSPHAGHIAALCIKHRLRLCSCSAHTWTGAA